MFVWVVFVVVYYECVVVVVAVDNSGNCYLANILVSAGTVVLRTSLF